MTNKPLNKIIFFPENRLHSSKFKWYKGNCKIDKIENLSVISPKKIEFYTPDIERVIINAANLDLSDDGNVLEFVNKYGLLGLASYYKKFFNADSGYPYPTHSKTYGIDEDWKIESMLDGNPNNPFFKEYYEPLTHFKEAISNFQDVCRVISNNFHEATDIWDREVFIQPNSIGDKDLISMLWQNELRWIEKYNSTKLVVVNNLGKPTFAIPVNSLLDYAYSALAWNIGNKKILKECKAYYKKDSKICNKFYWDNGKQKFCSKTCTDRMAKYYKRYGK
ncbi:hypothetical protein [uncultured Tissierella sp.]|uniref:hypothetical protein n=1 Tax=uncultured Tissierella sp. TaxID=448160 RepID=UPI0028046A45|nr:hypothetical protein [uncultured Tissierella sp.]MDU5081237.1 hypothetical protein [Bacillota bacterium]